MLVETLLIRYRISSVVCVREDAASQEMVILFVVSAAVFVAVSVPAESAVVCVPTSETATVVVPALLTAA